MKQRITVTVLTFFVLILFAHIAAAGGLLNNAMIDPAHEVSAQDQQDQYDMSISEAELDGYLSEGSVDASELNAIALEPNDYSMEAKISELLDRAYLNNSDEENDRITEIYENLTLTELKLFNKLRTKRDMQLYLRKNNLKSSPVEIKKAFLNLEDFRNQMVEQALALNGNAGIIMGSECWPLCTRTNCSTLNFPLATPHVNSWTTSVSWWAWINQQGQSDCDILYAFPGNLDEVDGTTWFADKLIDSWSTIKRRYDSNRNETHLLFGCCSTYFWVGPPGYTFYRIKMR